MAIKFNKDTKVFTLDTNNTSYLFFVNEDNTLEHLYYGNKLNSYNLNYLHKFINGGWSSHYLDKVTLEEKEFKDYYSESALYELANSCTYDKRESPLLIKNKDNSFYNNFRYLKHKIYKYEGNPSIYPHSLHKLDNEEVLEIELYDELNDLTVILKYIVFPFENVISRSLKIKNGKLPNTIHKAYSFSLDLMNKEYSYLHFYGDWSYERHLEKSKISYGKQYISSFTGRSGHEENPSLILFNDSTSESNGECFGFSLVYSGNFKISLERNKFDSIRVMGGINEECFIKPLEAFEEFECPEVILTYSNQGFNALSHNFHDFIREHIITSKFVHEERPILLNSWEGFYFDFDTEKVIDYITKSKNIDNELFVLDDGWFINRNDDLNGLGDWEIDTNKVDLNKVIEACHKNNLKFGLWFEPEMINHKTKLFKEHRDYVLGRKDINLVLSRHQLVLDMSNDEVIDYLFNKISKILNTYDIDYVKWDHNRYLSEIYSEVNKGISEGYLYHLVTLGTYKLFYKLTHSFPNILFEGCASGGGRFDLGMLYYTPQIWCSDETDPIQRTFIQYGTSYIYPLSTIGAHVSKNPITSYKTKAEIALFGTYGFEFNPSKITLEDTLEIKEINEVFHKFHKDAIVDGDLYRLSNPFESNYFSMMSVSKNKEKAVVLLLNYKKETPRYRFLKLYGLNENYNYLLSNGEVVSGEHLMNVGINITRWLNEFDTEFLTLIKVD